MSIKTVAFFNNKGGVGKTSLIYHLAWMYADLGVRTLAVDLDPQANLSAAFLDEETLEEIWYPGANSKTIYGALDLLIRGIGEIRKAYLHPLDETLALLPGDLALAKFEDQLSESWSKCFSGEERAFRITSAFWRIIQESASDFQADVVLVDLGPNLGAINRAALISTDHIVIPVAPDLFSLQGLRNLGPTFQTWRKNWRVMPQQNPEPKLLLPKGNIETLGYVVLQHAVRLNRPAAAYSNWIVKIPSTYRKYVLGDETISEEKHIDFSDDENCLALIKNYRSLMPMAQEAHKPIFHLKPADGAIGAHLQAARDAGADFKELALQIAQRIGLKMP